MSGVAGYKNAAELEAAIGAELNRMAGKEVVSVERPPRQPSTAQYKEGIEGVEKHVQAMRGTAPKSKERRAAMRAMEGGNEAVDQIEATEQAQQAVNRLGLLLDRLANRQDYGSEEIDQAIAHQLASDVWALRQNVPGAYEAVVTELEKIGEDGIAETMYGFLNYAAEHSITEAEKQAQEAMQQRDADRHALLQAEYERLGKLAPVVDAQIREDEGIVETLYADETTDDEARLLVRAAGEELLAAHNAANKFNVVAGMTEEWKRKHGGQMTDEQRVAWEAALEQAAVAEYHESVLSPDQAVEMAAWSLDPSESFAGQLMGEIDAQIASDQAASELRDKAFDAIHSGESE